MQYRVRLIMLAGLLGAMPLLSNSAYAQPAGTARGAPGEAGSDVTSVPDCPRPAEAKDVKVIDFNTVSAVAKLAVNLGSGRFKLVTIKAWDRPDDPRPLIPVIEAARIMQGNLQFYTPNLNADPESAHDTFLLMTEMGGGYVCWATPGSLLSEGAYPVAEQAKPASAPAAAAPASRPQVEARPASPPAAAAPAPGSRARTNVQARPAQ